MWLNSLNFGFNASPVNVGRYSQNFISAFVIIGVTAVYFRHGLTVTGLIVVLTGGLLDYHEEGEEVPAYLARGCDRLFKALRAWASDPKLRKVSWHHHIISHHIEIGDNRSLCI